MWNLTVVLTASVFLGNQPLPNFFFFFFELGEAAFFLEMLYKSNVHDKAFITNDELLFGYLYASPWVFLIL